MADSRNALDQRAAFDPDPPPKRNLQLCTLLLPSQPGQVQSPGQNKGIAKGCRPSGATNSAPGMFPRPPGNRDGNGPELDATLRHPA
eukprot:6582970-Heterocapsa_arctica.AAC.1